MSLNENEKRVLWSGIRCFIYFLLAMAFMGLINYLSFTYKENTFAENNIVENMQLSLIFTAGLSFLIQGILSKQWRPLMLFLGSLCFLASCRELDKTLDELIYGLRWRIGFIFPIMAIFYAYRNLELSRKNFFAFLESSTFYMLFCATIIIFPTAQLIGHRPLISNVLGTAIMPQAKELFEECSEVLGYFLILLSSIESYISLIRKK